jgi:hypothetical protein
MLPLAALGPAAVFGQLVAAFEFFHFLFELHGQDYSRSEINACDNWRRLAKRMQVLQRKETND